MSKLFLACPGTYMAVGHGLSVIPNFSEVGITVHRDSGYGEESANRRGRQRLLLFFAFLPGMEKVVVSTLQRKFLCFR